MTPRICVLLLPFMLFCCKNKSEETKIADKDFIDKTIEFVITNQDNHPIELPNLYDSLSIGIPEKSELILAKKLIKLGFKEIHSGRGNYPPRSPRIVTKIFQKQNCFCEVSKIYYNTTTENNYEMAERISCKDSLTKKE